MAASKSRIKADVAALETRIVERIGQMESRILRDISRCDRWMIGIVLAIATVASAWSGWGDTCLSGRCDRSGPMTKDVECATSPEFVAILILAAITRPMQIAILVSRGASLAAW